MEEGQQRQCPFAAAAAAATDHHARTRRMCSERQELPLGEAARRQKNRGGYLRNQDRSVTSSDAAEQQNSQNNEGATQRIWSDQHLFLPVQLKLGIWDALSSSLCCTFRVRP